MRDKGLDGDYSWDNKEITTGALTDRGKNNWTDARLNYLLNEGHDNEENGGSLYWNRKNGMCYSGQNNAIIHCDFTDSGLKEESKIMIDNALWYLGGTTESYQENNNSSTSNFYVYERSKNVYKTDEYENSINWTGKVGLIYPSDYGYATSGGNIINRNTCLSTGMYIWDSYEDCYQNNWLYDDERWYWTITAVSDDSMKVFRISSLGVINQFVGAYDYLRIYPTVYLKKNINIIFGNGSKENPYILYL